MKCAICSATINETFLKKIIGTYVKDTKGKKHLICFACQKQHNTKKELLAKLS